MQLGCCKAKLLSFKILVALAQNFNSTLFMQLFCIRVTERTNTRPEVTGQSRLAHSWPSVLIFTLEVSLLLSGLVLRLTHNSSSQACPMNMLLSY